MSTVKELLDAEVAKVRGDIAKLDAHASALEARIAVMPDEVKTLSEEAWEHIKALFGFPSKYLQPAHVAPALAQPAVAASAAPAAPAA